MARVHFNLIVLFFHLRREQRLTSCFLLLHAASSLCHTAFESQHRSFLLLWHFSIRVVFIEHGLLLDLVEQAVVLAFDHIRRPQSQLLQVIHLLRLPFILALLSDHLLDFFLVLGAFRIPAEPHCAIYDL